ncbi:alkaline phosphatase [Alkaliphilus peptidifermentans]|uniref:Alkaline phosphatase n=1 Tax=Alkaliphilus peptidifermentans DSM 18978 TaxID=1120976 RepID=A0A1G5ETS8_9FIRM|nr:alkaline phosphatase [Alkaliphilus peptidifermentans]SCY30382.1 alkaline phosphatase [Alkaliphilus peptidifermentans DSM 18978]
MFNLKKRLGIILSIALALALCVGFMGDSIATNNNHANNTYNGKAPKYVFLFIGDGMSFPQIASAEMYLGQKNGKEAISSEYLSFSKFPAAGTALTFDAESFIPDSASTATSLATGEKTLGGVINMDVTKQIEFTPITEKLKAQGKKIGIVTSVPITHATPACFYAKVPHRNMAYEIGLQLADSGFDYFAGGSFDQPTGKGKDQEHILDIVRSKGYNVVNTKEEILELNSKSGKTVAISPVLDGNAMTYEIDRKPDELALSDFVKKGIEVLHNKNGFFMMVESGKIDWAGHANDAAASIHDTIQFSKAIDEAIEFYNKYPNDTLIIVTGDHECGGMTIGFAGTGYETFFNKIDRVTMSQTEFNKIVKVFKENTTKDKAKLSDLFEDIKNAYGLIAPTDEDAQKEENKSMVLTAYEIKRLEDALKQTMRDVDNRIYTDQEKVMYGSYEPLSITLTHILNNKAGIDYTSFSHTGLPVPVYAIGVGHELFNGYYDNTDINKKIEAITKVK